MYHLKFPKAKLKCKGREGGVDITLFRSIIVFSAVGLTIFCKIFPIFNKNVGNIPRILSIPQNIIMDLNNVMEWRKEGGKYHLFLVRLA